MVVFENQWAAPTLSRPEDGISLFQPRRSLGHGQGGSRPRDPALAGLVMELDAADEEGPPLGHEAKAHSGDTFDGFAGRAGDGTVEVALVHGNVLG